MKMNRYSYKVWSIYFGMALLCQLLLPAFPIDFFAFPVNGALVLLVAVGGWIVRKERPASRFVRLLTSPYSTFVLLGTLAVSCLCLGLTAHPSPASWWFFFLLTALFLHLLMVFYAGAFRPRAYRLRFILIHGGLLQALLGGFAGSPDTQEWRMMVDNRAPTVQAVNKATAKVRLKHPLQLKKFEATFYANGTPQNYQATLTAEGLGEILLQVNHPYALTWMDDLYLLDYEHVPAPRYCILQLVRQPGKYVQRAGIWLLLAGCLLLFVQGLPQGMGSRKSIQKGGEA